MEQPECSWTEFDLSILSYPEFLAYFFDRPIDSRLHGYDLFRKGIAVFVASSPAIVVEHLRVMCHDFVSLTKRYSDEQIDQGLWGVFGLGIECEQVCFDPTVDSALRIDAIESMFIPFRDVVALHAGDVKDSFYWMWWDMILHTLWMSTKKWKFDWSGLDAEQLGEKLRQAASSANDYADLTEDQKLIAEAVLRVLLKILAIDHRGCQWCAIHGLNHLHHPAVPGIVQGYLDAHRDELGAEDIEWIQLCRDGRFM